MSLGPNFFSQAGRRGEGVPEEGKGEGNVGPRRGALRRVVPEGWHPEGWSPNLEKWGLVGWGLEGWGPEGWHAEGWGPEPGKMRVEGWGPEGWEPKISRFFPLPPQFSF